jgi:hypothetical protein
MNEQCQKRELEEVEEMTPTLLCHIDGNALCITGVEFENLQENEAVFIELTPEQIKQIEALKQKVSRADMFHCLGCDEKNPCVLHVPLTDPEIPTICPLLKDNPPVEWELRK